MAIPLNLTGQNPNNYTKKSVQSVVNFNRSSKFDF